MENMQQGQWRLAKEKKKCSFWDPGFPRFFKKAGHGSIAEFENGLITERESYEDKKTETVNNSQRKRQAEGRETLRETDPSYSCPAGERIGGDWGGPAGTCNWLHAGCVCMCASVCVCSNWLPLWQRMPGVQRPMQAPMKFSTEQNRCICFLNWRNLLMCIYEGK